MAIKELALITEAKNRKKKKQKETTPTITKPTKEVVKNKKGTTNINREKISTKPTVKNTTQNRVLTNKERLTSKPTISSVNKDIRTVKTTKKSTPTKKVQSSVYDVYERDGRYYYNNGKKEKEIDRDFIQRAIDNKKKGVIGSYDTKGKLKATDEKGNVIKKEKNVFKNAVRIGKGAKVGAVEGTTHIADAALQEAQNDLNKGEKLKKKDLPKKILKSLINSNPIIGMNSATQEASKNIKEAWQDKDKNLLQKGVKTAKELAQAASMGQLQGTKDQLQVLGSLDNSLDEKTEKLKKKINKPAEKMAKDFEKDADKYYEVVNDIANTNRIVGNMTPGIAVSAATKNPNLGIATMGLSAKGAATERALAGGESLDEAVKTGTLSGGIEAGTEKISTGLKIFGKGPLGQWASKGIFDDVAENLINSKIKNKVANFLAKSGLGIAGEFGEEIISDIAGVLIDKGTIDPNAKYTLKDFLDTAKYTFGSTAIINLITGGYSPAAFRQNKIDMQNYEVKQAQVKEVEQRVASGEVSPEKGQALVEQVKKGTYEQNKVLDQIANEKSQEIQQSVMNGQLAPQQGVEEMQVLDKTLTSEREKINNPEKYTEKIKADVMKIAETMAKDPSVTKEEFVKDWYSEQGEQELGITKQEVEDLYDKTQQQVQEQNQQESTQESAFNNEKESYRGSHQIENAKPITELNLDEIENKVKEVAGNLTKQDESDLRKLKKILNSTEETVKIYRASPINELNDGDWVTTDKSYAQNVADNNGGKVYEYEVKANQLNYPDDIKQLPSLHRLSSFQYAEESQQENIPAKTSENVISEQTKPTENVQQTETQEVQNEPTQEETQQESKGPEILDKMPKDQTKMREKLKNSFNRFRHHFTDHREAWYDASRKMKNPDLNARADALDLANGMAQVDIGRAQIDYNGKRYENFTDEKGNKVSMSFEKAYDIYNKIPVKDKNTFLVHQLNIDRWNQGKDQFQIPPKESEAIIAELRSKYKDIDAWSENIYQYYRNLRQKLVDSGRITQEKADEWNKTTPHYVHIQRQVDNQSGNNVSTKGGKVDSSNLIQHVKGSTKPILPIKQTTASYTEKAMNAIQLNKLAKEWAKTAGVGSTSNNIENINDMDDIFGIDANMFNDNGKGNYSIVAYDKGAVVDIPITKEMYEGLKPRDLRKLPTSKVTKVQRDFITNKNPIFGLITNPAKDYQAMNYYSKFPAYKTNKTYWKLFGGRTIGKAINNNSNKVNSMDWVNLYYDVGNAANSFYANGEFTSEKEASKGEVRKGLSKAGEFIEKGNNFMESMPRITEFVNTIEDAGYTINKGEGPVLVPQKGKNPTKTVEQVLMEASHNAAEITVNFKRGGTWAKNFDKNFAVYSSPAMQGAAKFGRTITEAVGDAKQGDYKAARRLVSRAAALGLAPAILNAVIYGDDDDYKELQEYQKDRYYLLKGEWFGLKEKWIRIPRGREISTIQSLARRTKNAAQGEEKAYKDYGKFAIDQVGPANPIDSNVFAPILGAYLFNRSWSGNKIVPDSLKDADAKNQYNEKTDELSKFLGKTFNISPMKLNYVLDQYSGVIGDVGLPYITPRANNNTNNPLAAIIQDKYTFDQANSSKNVSDFYDMKKKLKSSDKEEDKLKGQLMGTKAKDLFGLTTKKQKIQMDKNLSKKEKYNQALEVQKQINKFAKEATDEIKDADVKIDKYSALVGNHVYHKDDKGKWVAESEKTTEKRKELGLSPEKYYYYHIEEAYKKPDGYNKYITSGKNAKMNMAIVDAFKFDTSDYLEYTYKINQIKTGNTARNRKEVAKYINSLPISGVQKAYLYRTRYKSYRNQNSQIINQIQKSNLSKKEKEEMYSYLKLGR